MLFAPIGPNPAPLVELVWALHRQRGIDVRAAFVVADDEARYFLDGEVLAEGAALDQLHEALGARVLPRPAIHVAGAPADFAAYAASAWSAGRAAIAEAGDCPVVFALAAGRRRTMTAMATIAAELLARPQDLCVDVRVGDPRAEGGSGFFFPEQSGQVIVTPGGLVRASDVSIELIDVPIPRLRALLGDADRASYAAALAAGQRAIDVAVGPILTIDVALGAARVDGRDLPLSEAELVWLTVLAAARVDAARDRGDRMDRGDRIDRGDPIDRVDRRDGWIASADPAPWVKVARACRGHAWTEQIKSKAVRALLGQRVARYDVEADGAADLAKLRADTKRRIAAFCARHAPAAARALVPVGSKRFEGGALVHFQRLPLAPDRVALLGLA